MRHLPPDEARRVDEAMRNQGMVQPPVVVHKDGQTFVRPKPGDPNSGLILREDGRLEVPDLTRIPSGEFDAIALVHDSCDIIDEVADTIIKRGRRHFAALSDEHEEAFTDILIMTKGLTTGVGYITRAMHHCGKVRRGVNQTLARVTGRVKGEVSKAQIQAYDRLYNQWKVYFHQPYTRWLREQLGVVGFDKAMKDVKGNKQIWASAIEESFHWMAGESGWAISEDSALDLTTKFLIDAFADEGASKSHLIDMLKDGDIPAPKIRPQDRERAKRARAERLPKSSIKDLASEIKRKKKAQRE